VTGTSTTITGSKSGHLRDDAKLRLAGSASHLKNRTDPKISVVQEKDYQLFAITHCANLRIDSWE
jgi:hypothetical protein